MFSPQISFRCLGRAYKGEGLLLLSHALHYHLEKSYSTRSTISAGVPSIRLSPLDRPSSRKDITRRYFCCFYLTLTLLVCSRASYPMRKLLSCTEWGEPLRFWKTSTFPGVLPKPSILTAFPTVSRPAFWLVDAFRGLCGIAGTSEAFK